MTTENKVTNYVQPRMKAENKDRRKHAKKEIEAIKQGVDPTRECGEKKGIPCCLESLVRNLFVTSAMNCVTFESIHIYLVMGLVDAGIYLSLGIAILF